MLFDLLSESGISIFTLYEKPQLREVNLADVAKLVRGKSGADSHT